MTLTEFLLARIAEDEWAANASAFDPNWTAYPDEIGQPIRDGRGARLATCAESVMSHIARHDPARVLAECEAKRSIVEGYIELNGWEVKDKATRGRMEGLLVAAHLLAAPYADHPDYRDEWRP